MYSKLEDNTCSEEKHHHKANYSIPRYLFPSFTCIFIDTDVFQIQILKSSNSVLILILCSHFILFLPFYIQVFFLQPFTKITTVISCTYPSKDVYWFNSHQPTCATCTHKESTRSSYTILHAYQRNDKKIIYQSLSKMRKL